MNNIKFTTPIPPSVNSYLNYRVMRVGRRQIVKPFPTPETQVFQRECAEIVRQAMHEQGWIKAEKDEWCKVNLRFFFHKKGMDASNHNKIILDVLTKVDLWHDDQFTLVREFDCFVDKDNPRVEIEIVKLDKIGAFKNTQELDKFIESNCSQCTKNGKKTCRYMKEFLDNRVHNMDVDKLKCKERIDCQGI